MRAAWCEVHHVIEWNQGGDTSLVNAVTLCREHHHRVHRDHTHITPTRGGFTFTTAQGRTIGTTTRLDDELLVPKRRPTGVGRTLPTNGSSDDGPGGGRGGGSGSSGCDARGGATPGGAPPSGGTGGGAAPGGGLSGGDSPGDDGSNAGAAPGAALPGGERGGSLRDGERGGGTPDASPGGPAALW
ncbi:HNH endonuclease [Miniimonas arenae]|uniref:HNH endonuclease n=1 Tax=Miniimonas arenae TaxID=676201 RepID=A0A5C5B9D3_9MICO|nr:HNH endonuclease [Miniimonas arenae]